VTWLGDSLGDNEIKTEMFFKQAVLSNDTDTMRLNSVTKSQNGF
jgi:hypothetical protein